MKEHLLKEQEETRGLAPRKKFGGHALLNVGDFPSAEQNIHRFLLIFMVRRKNWIPNMFSSNFDDVDQTGKSYDDLVCTPKLWMYAWDRSTSVLGVL